MRNTRAASLQGLYQFTYEGLREGGMNVEPPGEDLMSGLRDIGGP